MVLKRMLHNKKKEMKRVLLPKGMVGRKGIKQQ